MRELKPKHRLAIVSLASGASIDETAASVNVSNTTIDTWLRDEIFKAELNAVIDRIFEIAVNKAAVELSNCIDFWITLRDDPDAVNRDRNKAAENLADHAWRRRDLRLDERLTALEDAHNRSRFPIRVESCEVN